MELEAILAARRTIRAFTPAIPKQADIEQILRAGLLAPHAGYPPDAQGGPFRRFSVVTDGALLARLDGLIQQRASVLLEQYRSMQEGEEIQGLMGLQAHIQKVGMISQHGVLAPSGTSCYIVAAEVRCFPPVQQETLAHVLENMWLQATALGLGFRLISITAEMVEDAEFCQLLDLPGNQFGINGCAIGYPRQPLPPYGPPDVNAATRWF